VRLKRKRARTAALNKADGLSQSWDLLVANCVKEHGRFAIGNFWLEFHQTSPESEYCFAKQIKQPRKGSLGSQRFSVVPAIPDFSGDKWSKTGTCAVNDFVGQRLYLYSEEDSQHKEIAW